MNMSRAPGTSTSWPGHAQFICFVRVQGGDQIHFVDFAPFFEREATFMTLILFAFLYVNPLPFEKKPTLKGKKKCSLNSFLFE